MRRILVGLALVVAVPAVAHADPVVYGTYIFEGCIENLSCHRAVVTTSQLPGYAGTIVDVDLLSMFTQPGMVHQLLMDPLPGDSNALDQLGSFCLGTGDVADEFQMGHNSPESYIPTGIRLTVTHGAAAPTDCFGPEATTITLLQVDPTVAPEPGTIALLVPGLVGIAALRRKRR
jgi:hypothetical protein